MTGMKKRSTKPRVDQTQMTTRELEQASFNYRMANGEIDPDTGVDIPASDTKRRAEAKKKYQRGN